ncbi:hypothetical protein ACFXD5_11780 [Streptomyces sp. NPDC059385]|uniref:hypothetical protein n=1 Tax=Streptomyces sp. NPDC059385 TaxID=3346817 RepID=UPI0036BB1D04
MTTASTSRVRLRGQAANHGITDPKELTTSCGLLVPLGSRALAATARITCRLCQTIHATDETKAAM